MTHYAPHPLTIRGVEYPSQGAAARALGISRSAIANAKARGTLENVGLLMRGGRVPCRFRGNLYGSFSDAARANGITRRAVVWAIETGREA